MATRPGTQAVTGAVLQARAEVTQLSHTHTHTHTHTPAILDKLWLNKEGPHFKTKRAGGLPTAQEIN